MSLADFWFVLFVAVIAAYIVLDGFDLGVGMLHPFAAKEDRERRIVLNSIGPIWDGNEVWLVVGGGVLFAAFPVVYASMFSGFYWALMFVLIALILRTVAIEFRGKRESSRWRGLWDSVFSASSFGLALLLGVAFGNVVTGVPLDKNGEVQIDSLLDLLHPFVLFLGVTTVAMLLMHGAHYLVVKTEGDLQARVRRWVPRFIALFTLTAAISAVWIAVGDYGVTDTFTDDVWTIVFPLGALVAYVLMIVMVRAGRDFAAFFSSSAVLFLSPRDDLGRAVPQHAEVVDEPGQQHDGLERLRRPLHAHGDAGRCDHRDPVRAPVHGGRAVPVQREGQAHAQQLLTAAGESEETVQPHPPSGEQHEIRHGDQVVVVAEVGATLRTYSAGGLDVLDGFSVDEPSSAGRGQVLAPWPNRLDGGRYAFDGRARARRRSTSPSSGTRSTGSCVGSPGCSASKTDDAVALECVLHPQPAYPWRLELGLEYRLVADGLEVVARATNASGGAGPVRDRVPPLPDDGDPGRRRATHDPGLAQVDHRRPSPPGRRGGRRRDRVRLHRPVVRSATRGSTPASPASLAGPTAGRAPGSSRTTASAASRSGRTRRSATSRPTRGTPSNLPPGAGRPSRSNR